MDASPTQFDHADVVVADTGTAWFSHLGLKSGTIVLARTPKEPQSNFLRRVRARIAEACGRIDRIVYLAKEESASERAQTALARLAWRVGAPLELHFEDSPRAS